MSSRLPQDEQRRRVEDIAHELVGDGLKYEPTEDLDPQCAAAFQTFIQETATFSLVTDKLQIWRRAAGYDEVTGVPQVDLVTGEPNP